MLPWVLAGAVCEWACDAPVMLAGILSILGASMPAARPTRGVRLASGVLAGFVFLRGLLFALGQFVGDFGFLFGLLARRFAFAFCAFRST
jgi:hypothetical protein